MSNAHARLSDAAALQTQGDLGRARTLCLELLTDNNIRTNVLFLLSIIETQAENYTLALQYIDDAIARTNPTPGALNNRGAILRALGRHDDALATYDRALTLDPKNADVLSNRANVLFDMGRPDDALACLDAAIAAHPALANAMASKANILFKLRRYDDARAANEQVLKIDPDNSRAWFGLGTLLAEFGDYDQAIAHYNRALASWPENPDAQFNRSLCLLRKGDFARGLPGYEYRWKKKNFTSAPRKFDQPLWDGTQDLRGKTILLHAEQGYGDTIQFLRYIPHISAGRIILEVQEPLLRLTQKNFPDITVIAQGQTIPTFDYHCPLMSLMLAMGADIANEPYLKAAARTLPFTSKKPRIGVAWSGRPTHRNDINRSIPLETFTSIFSDDYEFTSLQKDQPLPKTAQIQINDFVDTAEIIMALDLVITVDTSVAHLAGALGKPVWVLIPAVPDWRWLLDRADTPWYPTMRLYRQPSLGDWATPLAAVRADLAKL
jgi:tetratricopeptide (TPR) repeat protein